MSDEPKEPIEAKTPEWTCELQAQDAKLPPKEWFVGTRLVMQCQGDSLESPLTEYAQLKFPEEGQTYALKILEVTDSGATNAQFIVAPYRAGQFDLEALELADGETQVIIKNFKWETPSVFNLEELQGRPKVPFGPHPPMTLSLPWWAWASAAVGLVLLAAVIFRQVRKYLQRKKLMEELAQHSTALSPFNQFHKDLRIINRKYDAGGVELSSSEDHRRANDYLEKLDGAFRLYLVRQLYVPALKWTTREVLGEIRRRHAKVYKNHSEDIRRVLDEFDKAKRERARVSMFDCEQLGQMSRRVSEKIRTTTKAVR